MVKFSDEFLAMLQKGESAENIAAQVTASLNEAIAANDAAKKKAESKSLAAKKVYDSVKAFIKDYYPDLMASFESDIKKPEDIDTVFAALADSRSIYTELDKLFAELFS